MDNMTIRERAYKFRFYPDATQEELLRRTVGCTRLVWNKSLERIMNRAENEKVNLNANLTSMKKDEDYAFLREVSSVPLQQSIRHLNAAFKNMRKTGAGYPRFKRKANGGSATFMSNAFTYDNRKHTLKLAKMSESLVIRWSRTLRRNAVVNSVTITLTPSGKWFISLLTVEDIPELPKTDKVIGIDLGVKDYAITSDGEKVENPKWYRANEDKLAREQRKLSRRKPKGRNYEKQRVKIARLHEHTRNQRTDWLQKLTTRLIHDNQVICLETLTVRNMVKRVEPVMSDDGSFTRNGQAAHSGLAKSILDASWYKFNRMLLYKASWYGREVIHVSRFYPSSQLCSHCGYQNHDLTLADRSWVCPRCRAHLDRDVNAAVNILTAGLAVSHTMPIAWYDAPEIINLPHCTPAVRA